MKYLLDTHAFIWFDNTPQLLSLNATSICQDSQNLLLVSMASLWEMQIKSQLGKLILPLSLSAMVSQQLQNGQIELLPIQFDHILTLDSLPLHHRDPFDRLLIAQAHFEKMPILTSDAAFSAYPVTCVW